MISGTFTCLGTYKSCILVTCTIDSTCAAITSIMAFVISCLHYKAL